MKKDKNILNHFKKHKQPNVPDGFFDNFADELMSKIESEKSILDTIEKTEKPKVPEGFFENFADNLPIENNKKAKVISLKTIAIFTAIAASFLLLFVLNRKSDNEHLTADNDNKIQMDSTANDLPEQTEQDEVYLAYLTEDDMVEFIIDNNIDINEDETEINSENEDDLFDELDAELDDYIYEL